MIGFVVACLSFRLGLLAYIVIAVWFTYPLARHLSTCMPGLPDDISLFAWDCWYFSYALHHHLPLVTTDYLFYPGRSSLVYHTMDLLRSNDCRSAAGLGIHQPALARLRAMGARYLIVRYGMVAPRDTANVRDMLERQLRFTRVSSDSYATIYRLPKS